MKNYIFFLSFLLHPLLHTGNSYDPDIAVGAAFNYMNIICTNPDKWNREDSIKLPEIKSNLNIKNLINIAEADKLGMKQMESQGSNDLNFMHYDPKEKESTEMASYVLAESIEEKKEFLAQLNSSSFQNSIKLLKFETNEVYYTTDIETLAGSSRSMISITGFVVKEPNILLVIVAYNSNIAIDDKNIEEKLLTFLKPIQFNR